MFLKEFLHGEEKRYWLKNAPKLCFRFAATDLCLLSQYGGSGR